MSRPGCIKRPLRCVWSWLRDLSGEAAYDAHLARVRDGQVPLQTRAEFYLEALNRKYEGVSRCC